MAESITTFLMFEGQAHEAMRFYTSLFPKSEIVQMSTYGPEGPGPEGSVMHAIFTLNGQQVMASTATFITLSRSRPRCRSSFNARTRRSSNGCIPR